MGLFGTMRKKATGEWRQLHNEDLHDLYFSRHIVSVIYPWKMIWTERSVAHME